MALLLLLTACATPPPPAQPTAATIPQQPEFGDSSAGAYLAGRAAQSDHDLAGASFYLAKALADDPENIEILHRASVAFALEGRIAEAAALAGRMEAFDEESTVPAMLLAEQRAKDGDWPGLEAIVDHLPERGLNSYLLPLSRAWAKMGEGKIDLALAQLAGLDHIAGLGVLRQFNAGLINDLADRHQAAEQAFRATLSTAAGRTLRTEAVVASFFHRIGKDDEAHQLLAAFRHEHPDLPDLAISEQRLVDSPQAGLAEGYFGVAGTLRQANAADLALLFCELALDLKPDFPLAQLMTGDILTGLGQFDAANRAYRSLPADSPFVPSATLRVARNLESTKDLDGAAALLRALAQRQPQRPDALLALGDMWRRQKRWLDAVHAYDQALARIDGDDRSQWPAFYARGVALERANQWSRAEADLLHALDLQPDEPEVLNYLGYSWIEQSANLPRATAMIEKAVSLRPADGFIVDSLGWAFYRSGDFPRAVETLQKAVTLEPGDAAINDHLGDALWRAGRPEEARFQWQHALLSDPDPELRTQVADKLKRDQLPDAVIAPAEPSQ